MSKLNIQFSPPAKKSLGQCFLVEKRYAHEIVAALGICEEDTVVEIGPGRGFLTEELLKTAAHRVVAIEIDQRLIPELQKKFGSRENFRLVHSDFVDADLRELVPNASIKVIGNLPYHLSAEIIFRLLKHAREARLDNAIPWISTAVLMTQKEVANRIVAGPGSKTVGKLSVFVQLEAIATYLLTVPARAFSPQPKVDGGVIRLDFLKIPEHYPKNRPLLEMIVRYCYHQRRKMLKSTLSGLSGVHPHWQAAELDFTRRPETLSVTEWIQLTDVIHDRQSHSRNHVE